MLADGPVKTIPDLLPFHVFSPDPDGERQGLALKNIRR